MRVVYFDTETTGLPKTRESATRGPDNWPHLVSIAWIIDDDGEKIDKLNYELIVKKSMIENANDGMFLSILDNCDINNHSESNSCRSDSISGNSSNDSDNSSSSRFIIPGTVIGVYPGQVYLKSHLLQSPSNLTNLLPDNDFMLMTRYDECIIDGRTAHTLPTHPYALCHKINHCGLSKPNVMQVYNNL